MDKDGDGIILASEWTGDLEVFDHLDRNYDRVITREEFVHPPGHPDLALRFRALDLDGDGQLQPSELSDADETVARLDRNLDGMVSRDEFLHPPGGTSPQSPREQRFRELDRDHDGYVRRDEWTGSATDFLRLDRNGDGRLSHYELVEAAIEP